MAWQVGLRGDHSDLRMLAEALVGPDLSIVEHEAAFFLGGEGLDSQGDASSVREKALELIASISGASRVYLGSRRSVEFDCVVYVDEAGGRSMTVFPSPAVVEIRAVPPTVSVARSDGTVERHLPADPVKGASDSAAKSEAVRKVLRLRDRPELVWIDLTVIAEVIQADGFKLSKGEEDDLRRLTGSANHPEVAGDLARHGAPNWDPPPEHRRMKLHEARAYIDRLIRRWLASK